MKNSMLYLLLCIPVMIRSNAITYTFNGGRFGDNLSTYCIAKWYSFVYKIPLLYKPFPHSDELQLHGMDQSYSDHKDADFSAVVEVNLESDIKNNINQNVLFVTNFYTQTPGLYGYRWNHPQWKSLIQKALTPLNPTITIPEDSDIVTVALHVRKGGGFDKPLHGRKGTSPDQIWPTKFPGDDYYIAQIKRLRKLMGPKIPLMIYLLTDDPDPKRLVILYEKEIKDSYIKFTYRPTGNHHGTNIVEDFYILAQCDCLIRSSSLFAKAGQLLGDHKIIIYPLNGYWSESDNKVIIDPVGLIINS